MATNNAINNFLPNHLTIFTGTGIDGKSQSATQIGTTKAGYRFVPTQINIEGTNISGFVSVCSLSIGTNATSYNNILSTSALTGVNATNIILPFSPNSLISSLSPSTNIFVNVTSIASATTYAIRVSLLGFYF